MTTLSQTERDTPRHVARALLRGRPGGRPLFLPVAVGLASRIEGRDVKEFLENPTHLTRGLDALYRAGGLDAIFVGGPSAAEAESLGATLEWGVYPPRVKVRPWTSGTPAADGAAALVTSHPRIQGALEATRRLRATVRGDPLLAAAVTGPWTLGTQLAGEGWDAGPSAPSVLETCGRIVAELARQHCEAGSDLVVVVDEASPGAEHRLFTEWENALVPTINTLRFHKKLLVTLTGAGARGNGFSAAAVPRCVDQWHGRGTPADVVLTDGELPLETDLARLGEQVECFRSELSSTCVRG